MSRPGHSPSSFFSRSSHRGRKTPVSRSEVSPFRSGQLEDLTYGPREGLFDRPDYQVTDPNSGSSGDEIEHYGFDRTATSDHVSRGDGSQRNRRALTGSSHFNMAQSRQAPNLVAMLQEQQALLQKVLSHQQQMREELDSKYAHYDMQISALKEEVQKCCHYVEQSPSSGSPVQKKKYRVTKDLTKKVAALYHSLEEEFKPDESSLSSFNAGLKRKIVAEICSVEGCKYSEEDVRVAVQRKYESIRRQFKAEENDDHEELERMRGKKKKYRARKKRKYDNRALVVRESEMQYWQQLSLDFMTEESDDEEDGNTLIIHPLKWRSKKLMEFLSQLDARHDERVKKEGSVMAKKIRKIGSSSTISPPPDAPEWTIDAEWTRAHQDP